MKKYLLLFVLMVLCRQNLNAQYFVPKSQLTVNIDFSRFKLTQDTSYLEVYYLVFPSSVTLEKNGDTLKGSVMFHTSVRDIKTDSTIVRSRVSIPIVVSDTAALANGFLGKSIFMLPVGTYKLHIVAFDNQNPMRKDSVSKQISIDRYDEYVTISDIDICSQIIPSDRKSSIFYKNSYEVFPNPSLLLGKNISPVIMSYAELYNLTPDTAYLFTAAVIDGKGQPVKERRNIRRFVGRNVVDVNTMNITSIPTGKYLYKLAISDTLGKELSRSAKQIYIHNPHISVSASGNVSAKSAEFAGLTDEELIDEFRKAKYIANGESINMFENKITTKEGRREFLAKFWASVENGEMGRNDITRIVYLDRVSKANQRYHSMGKDGWNTDRGRVFILYGDPDEVQRYPSSENSKPYEVWNYYQIEGGVQFVFADRSGYGDYILVHSTKRGELQDENWEQNIK